MKFSILVPVYNVERYITECIDSLLNQTYKDYEIILVDDGSTDNSGHICDKYAEKFPNFVKVFHKKNEGLLLTRRYSLKKAEGEYVVFVDSDDYVDAKLLETLNQTFLKFNTDMVIYNFKRFTDEKMDFSSPFIPFKDGTVFCGDNKRSLYESYIVSYTFVNMWVKAVKRHCIDIDEDYSYWKGSLGEDITQSFALFDRCDSIVYIDKKLYYYRKNDNGLTMNVKPKDYIDFLKHYEISKLYLKKWNLSENVAKQFYDRQLGKFYFYLRRLQGKLKKESNLAEFNNTIENLIRDKRFLEICNCYTGDKRISSYVIRMKYFRHAALNHNVAMVKWLIIFSNLFGGIK